MKSETHSARKTLTSSPGQPENADRTGDADQNTDLHRVAGLLFTARGTVLLRKEAGSDEWALPQGMLAQTALPAGAEPDDAVKLIGAQSGYRLFALDKNPLVSAGLKAYVMRVMAPLEQGAGDKGHCQWLAQAEAERRLEQAGRSAELALLRAAASWITDGYYANHLPAGELPAQMQVKQGDWKNQPLPDARVSLPLTISLSATEAAFIRMGVLPHAMEDKWFCYYQDQRFYQHRSWSGNCVDCIHFIDDGLSLRATHAEVNRDPEQYQGADDNGDIERIERMLRQWVQPARYRPDYPNPCRVAPPATPPV